MWLINSDLGGNIPENDAHFRGNPYGQSMPDIIQMFDLPDTDMILNNFLTEYFSHTINAA